MAGTFPASVDNGPMKSAPLLLVPFREVRHDQPDDCLHYESVAVRGAEMDWTIPAHRHEGLHQFQWLESGQVTGTIDGTAFSASAPAMLLLAPGSVHGFTYTRDAIGHQVTLPSATLARLLDGTQLAQDGFGTSFVLDGASVEASAAECRMLFGAVAREFHAQHAGRVHSLLALATLLAVQFLRRRGEHVSAQKRPGVRDTLVQRYRALVDAHYREHLPLAFYAGVLKVTPDHLSRICRQVSGQSALDLLQGRVMLEARRLLAYTAMPVAGVAAELGYQDPAYFSKFFTRCVGDTPSGYRSLVASGVLAAGS
jgi:AraC family transcriptional activator of pobA